MTDLTFGQILTIAPSYPALTDAIKAKLEHVWGELSAKEVGAKSIAHMTLDLLATLPEPEYDNDARTAVAEDVNKLLQRFNLVPAAPQQPIKVVFDKTPDEMSLRELLEALAAQPDGFYELQPYIERHHQVIKAAEKSKGLWVITGADRRIDVVQTIAYVTHLGQPFSSVRREVDGRRPVTLASALGIDDRALIHPFTGRPVQGPDENGFDLSLLSNDLHEALLWAAATEHPAWPRQIDLYTHTEEVFETPLGRRWQRILDDYLHAKESGDDTVRLISRYWPKDVSLRDALNLAAVFLSAASGGPAQSGDTNRFKRMLEEVAQSSHRVKGMGVTVRGGVYRTINVGGMSASVNDVIVLSGGSIKGMGATGTIYAPPGVSVDVNGMDANVRVINLPWEQLAQRAGLV